MKTPLRILSVLSAALILASCAAPPKEPAVPHPAEAAVPPAARTALEGTWRETMNENRPVEIDKRWTFMGNNLTIKDPDRVYSGTFSCADDREPKEIDIHFEGYPVNKGIYRLDGDTLTIKVLDTAAERANTFGVEGGYISIVCEKAAQ